MYLSYFGLKSNPFSIAPDTRFLFLSESHREAIAHMVYALNETGGFVQLTGEVGFGKTTVCRYILSHLPQNIDVALILNPKVDEPGLLRALCDELRIKNTANDSISDLTRKINLKLVHSHSQGRHTLLIIDEAQNLPKNTLEQIRLLTNLETNSSKLLRIVLIGQPELAELLSAHDMRQVAQRITGRFHLGPLSRNETERYIFHRLETAGAKQSLFTPGAIKLIHQLTHGTPRLINILCDRALMGAFSEQRPQVDRHIARHAAKECLPPQKSASLKAGRLLIFASVLTTFAAAAFWAENEHQWLSQGYQSLKQGINQRLFAPKPQSATQIQAENNYRLPSTPTSASVKSSPNNKAPRLDLTPNTAEAKTTPTAKLDTDFRLGIPAKAPTTP